MNKKYFIILLVFFFIKKTHGCHPAGSGCNNRPISNYKCGVKVIDSNLLPNSILNMTVQSPNMYDGLGVSAIGHFSMRVDFNGGEYKFFDKPQWVNGCGCDKCDHIPLQYTIQKEFGLPTPPRGTWYDIWISVYWSCGNDSGNSRHCISEDIYYRDYVK